MICNFTHFSIALLWFLPAFSSAQTEPMDLSLEQSLTLLRSENKSLRIAAVSYTHLTLPTKLEV